MLRHGRLIPALACAALAMPAGCGSSGDEDEPALDGPWGSLGGAVDVYPDTPRVAVHRYVVYLQAGLSARALAQYVPSVRDEVGLRRMAAALEQVGSYRALGKLHMKVTSSNPERTRIKATIDPGDGKPVRHTFILLPRRDGWRIAFDGLTADSLEGWAAARTAARGNAEGAAAAGRRASEALMSASARVLGPEGQP